MDLVADQDSEVIGGSFRDAMGIDKLLAFFAKEPMSNASGVGTNMTNREGYTLAELKTARISDYAGTP